MSGGGPRVRDAQNQNRPGSGTFSMEEKVKMIEFLSYMAAHPDSRIEAHEGGAILLEEVMRCQPSQVDHLRVLSQASKNPEHIPRP